MFRFMKGVVALLFVVSMALAAMPAQAETAKTAASVESMLKEAKFKYTRDKTTFTLEFEGKGIGKFPVIIIVTDDMLSMLAYVAPASKITKSAALTEGLFAANNDYNFLKVLLDPKGNLLFRYDAFENMIDAADLKKLIGMMTENAVNMYNAPFIKK